ncbi:hypothetical protein [Phreatobacter sp.]|uniref:hypothetical protein n=1 Tax=Phreatobacter sp. TaxID=1966341 RepID=UPI003F72E7E0
MRRARPLPRTRVLELDAFTLHQRVKKRVCEATHAGGRCRCWEDSGHRTPPSCDSLSSIVDRIIDDVRRDIWRGIEEARR